MSDCIGLFLIVLACLSACVDHIVTWVSPLTLEALVLPLWRASLVLFQRVQCCTIVLRLRVRALCQLFRLRLIAVILLIWLVIRRFRLVDIRSSFLIWIVKSAWCAEHPSRLAWGRSHDAIRSDVFVGACLLQLFTCFFGFSSFLSLLFGLPPIIEFFVAVVGWI